MAHQSHTALTDPAKRAAQLDRLADAELAFGRHQQAERLAHAAAAFRTASVSTPRRALAALVGVVEE